MQSSFFPKFFTKIFIIIFWASLFLGTLYIPKIFNSLSSKDSINVATWTDMLDEVMIKKFEEETGIHINLSYFDNNDELLVKIRATKGEGYDLIIPSDHTVELLKKDGLLKAFDKSKITVWNRIEPRLLGAYFDPENAYSIPYYWGIYGIGVNTVFFNDQNISPRWDLIFKPLPNNAKISMLDNPREAILLTALYVNGSLENINECVIQKIKKLLIEQKRWVEAYTEFRADYLLLSTTCPVVVTTTPAMFRLMGVQSNIDFLVPEEGTFMTTDNWVIPQASTKEESVYAFINFLYRPEVIKHHFDVFTFIPATIDLKDLLKDYPSIYAAHSSLTHRFFYFRNVLSESTLNDIWIALKAS